MNFLSHYCFNHDVCGLPRDPYFAMGVALPDLWARYSRTRRIRWRHLESAAPQEPAAQRLRAGLLNHADADRRFHGLRCFHRWQRDVRGEAGTVGSRAAVADFLAHVAVELALDVALIRADAPIVERFYCDLSECDPVEVERHTAALAGVETDGLADVICRFLQRRFLSHYLQRTALVEVVRRVIGFTSIPEPPAGDTIARYLEAAQKHVDPLEVWRQLNAPAAGR